MKSVRLLLSLSSVFLLLLVLSSCLGSFLHPCHSDRDCEPPRVCKMRVQGQRYCYYSELSNTRSFGGIPVCANPDFRTGSSSLTLHLVPLDAYDVSLQLENPAELKFERLRIEKKGTFAPKVLDAGGKPLPGAKVELSLVKPSSKTVPWHVNPQFTQLRDVWYAGSRVPHFLSLWLDVSKTATQTDKEQASARIIRGLLNNQKQLNCNTSIGFPDYVDTRVFGYNFRDEQCRQFPHKKHSCVSGDGEVDSFFSRKTSQASCQIENAYVFEALVSGISSAISKAHNAQQPFHFLFHPQVVAIVASLDQEFVKKKEERLKRTKGYVSFQHGFIPTSTILFPRPSGASQANWDEQFKGLCDIAMEGGPSRQKSFGHVIRLLPENKDRKDGTQSYDWMLRSALKVAYQAHRGYYSLKVRYNITGVPEGKRVYVEFSVGYKQFIDPIYNKRIVFEARP